LKQRFQHNSCYLSNDNVFSANFYVLTYLCLFEWKKSSKCFSWNHMSEIFHIKLKWGNEIICNIWLNTSWSLVIVWIVFETYFHFAVYRDDYKSLNINFKMRFFLTILFFGFCTLFQVPFANNPFNITLVEV
jgi:hypothetical protein